MYREGFSWVNGTCKLGVQGNSIFLIAHGKMHYNQLCAVVLGLEYNVSFSPANRMGLP